MGTRVTRLRVAVPLVLALAVPDAARACVTDADCGCDGTTICDAGACVPAFTLPVFPIALAGASAYATSVISVVDHAGSFYTGCCDTEITAFTGEHATRGDDAVLCPAPPTFPACLFAACLCGYSQADGTPFVVSGNYVGVVGPTHLQYDGHAGTDYEANAGTALVATRAGSLCKALVDPVNGTNGQPTAWDGFHSFYIDHGIVAGFGWASWYMHATDLVGTFASLAPGDCAPVTAGAIVATAGNVGTFLPHLHFEVRRHLSADGPEGPTARIVDPYGWRGAAADPWSLPGGNPQATSIGPALWRGCGNGRVECGEACDGGPCCTETCTLVAAGLACSVGDNPCADERCAASGACVDQAVPRSGCRAPTASRAASLALQAPAGSAPSRLQWKWGRGAATTATDFGDPTAATGYRLCGFRDDASPALLFGAAIPAGGQCPATTATPCWKGLGTPAGSRGHRYRNREATPDGVESLRLQPGDDGRAMLALKARGAHLALPSLPLTPPLRVQLWADGGACWEARYDAAGVTRNDAGRFTAKSVQ